MASRFGKQQIDQVNLPDSRAVAEFTPLVGDAKYEIITEKLDQILSGLSLAMSVPPAAHCLPKDVVVATHMFDIFDERVEVGVQVSLPASSVDASCGTEFADNSAAYDLSNDMLDVGVQTDDVHCMTDEMVTRLV